MALTPADFSLPPGFLQSEYARPWLSVLQQYNAQKGAYAVDPNTYADNPAYEGGANADPGGLSAWLKNAPVQFNAGRSLADFQRPTTSGQIGGFDPASIGQLALGGAGGLAMGSGVGATEGGIAAGVAPAGTATTGVTPVATAGIGGGDTGLMAGLGGGGAGGSVGAGALEGGGMSPVVAGEGATVAGAGSGSGTALSRILDGSASTADWLSIGGNLGSTALGIAGSRNQANAFRDLNNQYMAMGAPSRGRYEASMTPGFDPNSIPGYSGAVDTASKGILARLAATGGNPWGNPGGLIEANKQIISGTALPAIQDYQRLNAGTGGYAGFNAAAPGAATAGIGAQGGVYNAVGSGLAGLLNPQPSLYDTLRGLGIQGLS
jgi:hypothetical protein